MILATQFTENFRKEFKENFTIYCPLYSKCYMVLQENIFPISCEITETFYVSSLSY